MAETRSGGPDGHGGLMDAIYRRQRHIYDLTRKYFLIGRDRLIGELDVPPGGAVLEAACGTGRNLVKAAKLYPQARFFGFDISEEMLKQARRNIAWAGLQHRIVLAQGDATNFDPQTLFGVEGFDRIFISYSLSMIPHWREAIKEAVRHLGDGGSLHVVDFGQQDRLPGWFRTGLHAWLKRFHVTPREDLEAGLRAAGEIVRFEPIFRGYARHGVIRR